MLMVCPAAIAKLERLNTLGAAYLNPANRAVPPVVVSTISPGAPSPGITAIRPCAASRKDNTGTPPKLTEVTPSRFWPEMYTSLPVDELSGVKPVITGGGR